MLRLYPNHSAVGVAPGTTAVQLGACPPDPAGWMADLRTMVARPDPTTPVREPAVAYSPYASVAALRGPVQTAARIRWDIIGLIGGGALVISLTIGLIASALPSKR